MMGAVIGPGRENPETHTAWPHGLWLAQLSARATPPRPELALHRHSRLCRAVLVLIVLFAPHRPACPAPCGLPQLSRVGYGTFQCSLHSSPTARAEEPQFGWSRLLSGAHGPCVEN